MITFEKILNNAFVRGIAIPTASIGPIVKILDFDLYSNNPYLLSLLFTTMVHEVNRVTAIEAGAIQVLVKALDRYPQTDYLVQRYGARANDLFVNYTLSGGTEVLVSSAIGALSTMTEHYDGVASVSAAGASAIGPILELAKSDQTQTAEPAIRTLVQIVKHDIGLHAVIAGGLIPLVQALASYPTYTYPMSGILEKISSSQGVDTVTTTEIESLLEMMESEDSRLAISSFKLLALFLRHEKGVAVVIAAGAIDRLMAVLRTHLLEEAWLALNAILAHEIGVDAVTAYLERNPQTVKCNSIEEINVLSKLSRSRIAMDAILTTEVLQELLNISKTGIAEMGKLNARDLAIEALLMISNSDDGLHAIIAAGARHFVPRPGEDRDGMAVKLYDRILSFGGHDAHDGSVDEECREDI